MKNPITSLYEKCDCSKCINPCIHKNAYRRLPMDVGGLGLCKNLNKSKSGRKTKIIKYGE